MSKRPYPTGRDGFVLMTPELFVPDIASDRENNHHAYFSCRRLSQFLILQTLRDLATYQEVLPTTEHTWIHSNYMEPQLPSVDLIRERIFNAYDGGELLRYGSANLPVYQPLGTERIQAIEYEFKHIRRLVL